MVDMQWRYTLLAFMTSFMGSWLVFAVVWWLISLVHGDYTEENWVDGIIAGTANNSFVPCILANKESIKILLKASNR